MARIIFVSAVLLGLVFITGCVEVPKDDPRFRVDPAQAAIATDEGFAMPQAAEVDLAEQMAAHRSAYRAALGKLADYYNTASGDATKLRWAQRELASLVQYRYLMPAEAVEAGLAATDSIEAADVLFEEAMQIYRDARRLVVIDDDDKLRAALRKFDEVITDYPSSDKIDDAAYRAGWIYEHFKDYEIAAVYYQRAFQWDENTPYPARLKAAYVLDKFLHMRKEALALYRLACEKESRYVGNTEFAKRRILEMTAGEAGASK